jgi:serine/threonine-protein kinase
MIEEADALDAMIGRRLGGAVVVRLIGAGGMGAVYEAENPLLGRRYAIKVVLPELAGNASTVERFLQETRAAAAIQHPRIVSIIDCGYTDDGRPYQVMPLLDGSNLVQFCQDAGGVRGHAGRLAVDQAAPLFFQILDGLSAAHDSGIIHRDLKGANIQVLGDGTIRILDFGIAKLFNPSLRVMVRTGTFQVIGTPGYMAPEQARGGAIDHRADLWALGAVFFKTMTGRLPFEGDDPIEIAAKALLTPAPTATELVPDVPARLSRVLLSCLAPDPDDRPDSARTLAYELMDALPDSRAIAELVAPELLARSGPGDRTVRREAEVRGDTPGWPSPSSPIGTPSRPSSTLAGPGALAVARAVGSPSIPRLRVRGQGRWRVAVIALVAGASIGIGMALMSLDRREPEAVPVNAVPDARAVGARLRVPLPADRTVAAAPAARPDAGPDGTHADERDGEDGELAAAAHQDEAPEPVRPVGRDDNDEKGRTRRTDKRSPARTGLLVITASPWADVWIDRKHINSTPVEKRLSVGRHTVRMKRPDATFDTFRVTIREGQTTRVDRNWTTSGTSTSRSPARETQRPSDGRPLEPR